MDVSQNTGLSISMPETIEIFFLFGPKRVLIQRLKIDTKPNFNGLQIENAAHRNNVGAIEFAQNIFPKCLLKFGLISKTTLQSRLLRASANIMQNA